MNTKTIGDKMKAINKTSIICVLAICMLLVSFVGISVAANVSEKGAKTTYPSYYRQRPTIPYTTIPTTIPITVTTDVPTPTPTPTVTATPTPVPTVTPQCYTAYHRYNFRIMVIDGIDENMVREAVLKLPNVMGFEFVPEGTLKYHVYTEEYATGRGETSPNPEYYGLVVPEEPYTVIIYDSTLNYPVDNHKNDGMCFKNINSISLCGNRFDTAEQLSLFIYHEFSHFEEFTGNGCNVHDHVHEMLTNQDYETWLPDGLEADLRQDKADIKNGISVDQGTIFVWERMYYDYLYETYKQA
jgi:hypothetical protein